VSDDAAIRHEIEQQYQQLCQAILAKDAALFMVATSPDWTGRDLDGSERTYDDLAIDLAAFFAAAFEWRQFEIALDSIEVNGDSVVVEYIEHSAAEFTDANGERWLRRVVHARERETWQRTADQWLCVLTETLEVPEIRREGLTE
jgi:hypothetical protein